MLYSSSLCMVSFTPFSPRGEACLPVRKPPFMHRERKGELGPTFSKQRRSICQLVPSMEGRTRVLISCGGFPNVPLMGTRGCISYNPVLAIRQLGYPMRGAPLEDELTPVISRGFNKTNVETLQKVRKAWGGGTKERQRAQRQWAHWWLP